MRNRTVPHSGARSTRGVARIAVLALLAGLAAAGCRTVPRARTAAGVQDALTIGEGFLAQEDFPVAKVLYEDVLKNNPSDGMAHLGLARAALGLGEFQAALHELNLAENGRFMDAAALQSVQIIRGRTYIRMGKPPVIVWAYLYPIWRKGDTAVKSCLDAEIKALVRHVPPETEGARAVMGFVPPPRAAPQPLPHMAREEPAPLPAGRLSILPRARWNPAFPARVRQMLPMDKPFRLTVHHSAHDDVDSAETLSGTARLIRSMQESHIRDRDWADLAYHYVIDPKGRVWEGRSIKYQGAHAGNETLNRGNIGIVLMGDFEETSPTTAAVANLIALVSHLCRTHGIPPNQIYGHQDLNPTKCPGRHLEMVVRKLRAGSG